MNDDLGDRMKGNYEDRTRYLLPRRTYTILRLDGKAFHTYTKGLKKPFDGELFEDIDAAIIAMMPQIQGAVLAYTQSDEISILLCDFAQPTTSAWFDGNLQKVCSVSASIMTAEFNKLRWKRVYEMERANNMEMSLQDRQIMKLNFPKLDTAYFDARVFTIADRIEVMNYFIWRNQDCSRNSVSMVAQSFFSHKELQGKSTPAMHDMLHGIGKNWATDYTDGEKNGRLIVKESFLQQSSDDIPISPSVKLEKLNQTVLRSRWVSKGAWKFTEDKEKLLNMVPKYE
jgi:tRNA(His) guanylyltransferase